jgi:hypothetical protein
MPSLFELLKYRNLFVRAAKTSGNKRPSLAARGIRRGLVSPPKDGCGNAMNDLINIEIPSNEQPIRVFPIRTSYTPDDERCFVGFPPLFRPGNRQTSVYVSVVFKWCCNLAEKIKASWADFYENVRIGGPAYGDYGDDFTPGLFLKVGCTITSRGCVKHCGWCPEKDRPLRELAIQPGWIVQDSNLLACSETHVRKVFDMLREQKRAIRFPGGLDKHFLKPWHRELFDSIPIDELWFACDLTSDLPWLEKAAELLEGIPMRKLRCYTMIGYDEIPETLAEAERRIERVFELGFMPFCQLYKPDDYVKIYPPEWKAVQRKWARPAAYMKSAVAAP